MTAVPAARPPIPSTAADRPTVGGVVAPWANVQLADGGVDFRSQHNSRWLRCWREYLCQMCGNPLTRPMVALCGPNQLRELLFDEPPLHPECAVYASKACPMVAGERTHFADRDLVSSGRRGHTCPDPDCDCEGWVPTPGITPASSAGAPAVPYFAVYLSGYELAAASSDPTRITGGIATPDQVLAVRRVSTPGEGRCWTRMADPLADYDPPQRAPKAR